MIVNVRVREWKDETKKIFTSIDERNNNIITLGNMSYIVDAVYADGSEGNGHVLIGRYTSVAHGVAFNIFLNHDYKSVTSYPIDAVIKKMDLIEWINNRKRSNDINQIIIGNDVWIGSDVKICGAKIIGNGAIIASGSIVTKDVPPYAIVGGNPARIIRYRFTDDIIYKLQSIKWWYWPIDKIYQNFDLMKDPEKFCNVFYKEKILSNKDDLSDELANLRKSGYKIYYMIADLYAEKPLYNSIIDSFIKRYSIVDKRILIVFSEYEKHSKELYDMCSYFGNVYVYSNENITDITFVKNIDYFITTKEAINSMYVDYCSGYGVEILSGLDYNIFE